MLRRLRSIARCVGPAPAAPAGAAAAGGGSDDRVDSRQRLWAGLDDDDADPDVPPP